MGGYSHVYSHSEHDELHYPVLMFGQRRIEYGPTLTL